MFKAVLHPAAIALVAAGLGCVGAIDRGAAPAGGGGVGGEVDVTPGNPAVPMATGGAGGGGGAPGTPAAVCGAGAPSTGPSPLRRLTHLEYDSTVRDLLR